VKKGEGEAERGISRMVVSKNWQHCKCSSEQLHCTQFDPLILRKIFKIVATIYRCHILRLKCTKFNFGWAPPQTPLGQLTALPRPLARFQGSPSKQREGGGKKGEEEGIKLPNDCLKNLAALQTQQ